jgi:acyl-CoA thioesterase FadM
VDAPRRLSHRYQVRFDEADAQARLRPSGFLRYAQDVAWQHSEAAGFGREWYAEREVHWLVRNVALRIVAPVTYGDTLEATTQVTGWRHVWARRQAEVRHVSSSLRAADAPAHGGAPAHADTDSVHLPRDGPLVATVQTDWVLLRDDGRPARVPGEIAAWFAGQGGFERNRVRLPDAPTDVTRLTIAVRPLDVDPMGHMNNAAYLDVVEDAIARLRSDAGSDLDDVRDGAALYRIGYLRPALPGTELQVRCWQPASGVIACCIADGDDEELTRVLIAWGSAA